MARKEGGNVDETGKEGERGRKTSLRDQEDGGAGRGEGGLGKEQGTSEAGGGRQEEGGGGRPVNRREYRRSASRRRQQEVPGEEECEDSEGSEMGAQQRGWGMHERWRRKERRRECGKDEEDRHARVLSLARSLSPRSLRLTLVSGRRIHK